MRYALLVLLAACAGHDPIGKIRFAAAPPVWRVDDRRPATEAPRETEFYRTFYKLDSAVTRRATRALAVHDAGDASDVNSLGEVPDSTWFTNRIGRHDLSIDQIRRGPNTDVSPFARRPWTVTGAKIGGKSLGFTLTDADGRKFLLKFDEKAYPETETAAHIIVHRILWAAGFNVPQDFIGYIDRKDLVLGDKARAKGLDDAKLDAALEKVYVREDGKIRVLASMFLDGKVLGPYAREGMREDDPNDIIPHQNRRSLRGQYPLFGWLDHTDMKEDNTVDVFANGYVTHYLVDFGKALGFMAQYEHDLHAGFRYQYDIPETLADLFTLGFRSHRWDSRRLPGLRGVGMYDAEHFDPGAWRPMLPYWPLAESDRFDSYWGAALMMRFSREQLAAIVDEAQLSDPRARAYMTDTLVRRQRMMVRYWFDRVTPLDNFSVAKHGASAKLCFDDLMVKYRLRPGAAHYTLASYDRDGAAVGMRVEASAGALGTACVATPLAGDYTIVRIDTRRQRFEQPPVLVHIARDVRGKLTVVGLRRR